MSLSGRTWWSALLDVLHLRRRPKPQVVEDPPPGGLGAAGRRDLSGQVGFPLTQHHPWSLP